MSLAYNAMMFARDVHKDQVRKYTGDMRTTPVEVISMMRELYAVGLRVADITSLTGIPVVTVRNYVANHDLQRDPSRFEFGVAVIAQPSERFSRLHWAPDYYVSDLGRLVGMTLNRPGLVLQPTVNSETGYHSVKLVEADGTARHNYIHRAVLRAFVGEPSGDEECAHGDGVKSNNRLSNLRWDTPAGNSADKDGHGTLLVGSTHPNAKIDEVKAAQIKLGLAGGLPQAEVSRRLGVSRACVANIAQGKTWRRVPTPA